MADNDNRKPAEGEETWQSLGEVVARLLRDIAEKAGGRGREPQDQALYYFPRSHR